MGVLAQHLDIGEDRVVAVGDGADGDAGFLQQRALFDVQFEIGIDGAATDGVVAVVADAPEFVAEAASGAVGGGMGLGEGEHAGEDRGAHQAGGEAGAFLVGPVDDFQGASCGDAGFGDAAHGFERAEHAERAVEFAARRLGVEVAAEHHRGEAGVAAFAAGEHVAHGIDGDRQAGLAAPIGEQVAGIAVAVGQAHAVDAAMRQGGDRAGGHEVGPQAFAVDADWGHGGPCARDVAMQRSLRRGRAKLNRNSWG